MWLPPPESNSYLSEFTWVEVMRYFPHLGRAARQKVRRKDFIAVSDVEEFANVHKRLGIYLSIFQRNSPDFDSPALSNLYFDLDNVSDFRQTQRDAIRLANYLTDIVSESGIHLYFSGKKGFHIECEALALGIDPAYDNSRHYRYIAAKLRRELLLSSIDNVVYEPRRVWRLPNSIHQETGKYKVELILKDLTSWDEDAIFKYASQPQPLLTVPQSLNIQANQWYRELVAQHEEEEERAKEKRFQQFLERGTELLRSDTTIDNEIRTLLATPRGGRNHALNRAAFNMGRQVMEGKISEEEVRIRLEEAALVIELNPSEIKPTIESGLSAGKKVLYN